MKRTIASTLAVTLLATTMLSSAAHAATPFSKYFSKESVSTEQEPITVNSMIQQFAVSEQLSWMNSIKVTLPLKYTML